MSAAYFRCVQLSHHRPPLVPWCLGLLRRCKAFEACSSFTRVTACKIARPPKGGLLSRGSGPASYPTKPLGSYHVSPTTTWMDPPSTGDLRRWGALLTTGWPDFFGSPNNFRKAPGSNSRVQDVERRKAWKREICLEGLRSWNLLIRRWLDPAGRRLICVDNSAGIVFGPC